MRQAGAAFWSLELCVSPGAALSLLLPGSAGASLGFSFLMSLFGAGCGHVVATLRICREGIGG